MLLRRLDTTVAALGVVAGQPAEHRAGVWSVSSSVKHAASRSDLAFRRRVERLRHRVVGAGADGSHRLGHAEPGAEIGVGLRGVDRTVVAVEDRSCQRSTGRGGGLECISDEVGSHVVRDRPAHQAAAVAVDHRGEIQVPTPAGLGQRQKVMSPT